MILDPVEIELYYNWSTYKKKKCKMVSVYGNHSDVQISKLKTKANVM